jgi:hypothetical protein
MSPAMWEIRRLRLLFLFSAKSPLATTPAGNGRLLPVFRNGPKIAAAVSDAPIASTRRPAVLEQDVDGERDGARDHHGRRADRDDPELAFRLNVHRGPSSQVAPPARRAGLRRRGRRVRWKDAARALPTLPRARRKFLRKLRRNYLGDRQGFSLVPP